MSMEPTNSSFLNIIGEVKTLSFLDIKIVNQMYNCSGNYDKLVFNIGPIISFF